MSKFWIQVVGTTAPTQVTYKQDDNIDDLKKAAKVEIPTFRMAAPHDIIASKDKEGQDCLEVALKLSDLKEANSSHNPIWLKLQEEPQPKRRKFIATEDDQATATLPPRMGSSSLQRSLEGEGGYEWITWEDVLAASGVQKGEEGVCSIMAVGIPLWMSMYKSITPATFEGYLKTHGCTEPTAEKFRKAFDELSQRGRRRQSIEERCPPPSSLADESQWATNQKTLGILCHRPPPPCHGLHVSLQVETFGIFMDDIKSEVDSEYKYIDIAIDVMLQLSRPQTEDSMKTGLTKTLAKVFPQFKYSIQSVNWNEVSAAAKSDISVSSDRYTLVNIELKRGLGSGGKDANFENIGYFIKIQKHHQKQRAPMFLVSIVGCHYLQVFGATWDGDCVCVDPLCSPLSLLYVPHDPNNGIMKVARLLSALATAVDNLKNEYDEDTMWSSGPYFNAYENIQLKNMKNIANKNRVFQATADEEDVVVKFVAGKYGLDAHKCLAQHNLAPRILHSDNLRGDWVVVVMEKIEEGIPLSETCMNEDLKTSLRNAVDILHSNNFVHGDLRSVNILALRDNTVRILDFDWAGTSGVAKYPVDLNRRIEWHQEVQRGCLIKKAHDNYLIRQILYPI